ncbi:helix-turn-helix transcriptional regulator [Parvibaculum sp.]|uniref:helix-turn-helix domain-containing protein n=1 Tax=Parvibaculum sp. TaxID=2024848 RepID=UPI0025FA9FC7|nr:helix-turn-helix transcriptional regulator [Parvibaculum sp.]
MSDSASQKISNGKAHQRIADAEGKTLFVVVPAEEYALLTQTVDAAREMLQVRSALSDRLVDRLGGKDGVPARVAHRIADGENPVRVWRENRGLKAVALARAAGISPAYLSEIETGKKDGTFRTMASIARVLNVSLDDLAPPADDDSRKARERSALVEGVRAQVRTLVDLVTGPSDFNTAAVRRAVTTLAGDAVTLKANGSGEETWLEDVLTGVRAVLDLVDKAESDIIATAARAQSELEGIVTQPGFMPAADLAGRNVSEREISSASAAE